MIEIWFRRVGPHSRRNAHLPKEGNIRIGVRRADWLIRHGKAKEVVPFPHVWFVEDPDEGMLICWECDTYKGSHASSQPCFWQDKE